MTIPSGFEVFIPHADPKSAFVTGAKGNNSVVSRRAVPVDALMSRIRAMSKFLRPRDTADPEATRERRISDMDLWLSQFPLVVDVRTHLEYCQSEVERLHRWQSVDARLDVDADGQVAVIAPVGWKGVPQHELR